MNLKEELSTIINKASRENESNTPDFILASYLMDCLQAYEKASKWREDWYGKRLAINDNQSQWNEMPRPDNF